MHIGLLTYHANPSNVIFIPERKLKSLIDLGSKDHFFHKPLHILSRCGDAPYRNHPFGWCLSPILQLSFQKSLKVNESAIYLNWICLEQHLLNHQWKCCSSHSLHSKLLQHALRIHNMKSNTKNAVSAQFLLGFELLKFIVYSMWR